MAPNVTSAFDSTIMLGLGQLPVADDDDVEELMAAPVSLENDSPPLLEEEDIANKVKVWYGFQTAGGERYLCGCWNTLQDLVSLSGGRNKHAATFECRNEAESWEADAFKASREQDDSNVRQWVQERARDHARRERQRNMEEEARMRSTMHW